MFSKCAITEMQIPNHLRHFSLVVTHRFINKKMYRKQRVWNEQPAPKIYIDGQKLMFYISIKPNICVSLLKNVLQTFVKAQQNNINYNYGDHVQKDIRTRAARSGNR